MVYRWFLAYLVPFAPRRVSGEKEAAWPHQSPSEWNIALETHMFLTEKKLTMVMSIAILAISRGYAKDLFVQNLSKVTGRSVLSRTFHPQAGTLQSWLGENYLFASMIFPTKKHTIDVRLPKGIPLNIMKYPIVVVYSRRGTMIHFV